MTYEPTWESIKTHSLPDWYDGAKLGIFIHWGLYSVPAWAPTTGEFGKIDPEIHFKQNPYAEWYQNTLRIEDSPTAEHHEKVYGKDFKYSDFADLWKAENWDPEAWASLFKDSGASYVVLTTMHHEGFNLWPSQYNSDFSVASKGPKRDIVGELTDEVRRQEMKMGYYYSGAFNWTFTNSPIEKFDEQKYKRPQTYEYADYAYNQVMELIDIYNPDILWNDIGWPDKGLEDVKHLFAHFYNQNPEGVVNDRWHMAKNNFVFEKKIEDYETWSDFTTEEYTSIEKPASHKWEATRGLGYSFSFNQNEGEEETISLIDLVHLLVDVVSKNGNLLIGVGPKADGSIPEIQKDRLEGLGNWLEVNGEAIYHTKPWKAAELTTENGLEVRFTTKDENLYMILLGPFREVTDNLVLPGNEKIEDISPLDSSVEFSWKQEDKSIKIKSKHKEEQLAQAFKIRFSE